MPSSSAPSFCRTEADSPCTDSGASDHPAHRGLRLSGSSTRDHCACATVTNLLILHVGPKSDVSRDHEPGYAMLTMVSVIMLRELDKREDQRD
jgi:hypothetical protein